MAVPSFLAGSRHVSLRNGRIAARSAYADGPVLTMPRTAERRSLVGRLGADRIVPAVAVAIVAIAVAISSAPSAAANGPAGPVGGPTGDGPGARLAAGAGVTQGGDQGIVDPSISDDVGAVDHREGTGTAAEISTAGASTDAFVDDGTIVKPVAVDTTVADGKGLMRSYRVRSGDTLTGIARKFGVSMMTVWWANNLTSKSELHVGQTLTIPPVSGLVVTVAATDSLDTLATKYHVEPGDIVEANELDDPNLVIGQTLTIPGALGSGIAAPKPAPATPHKSSGSSSSSSGGGSAKPPAKYTGGAFAWPVAGGYISQYYHYGHYAIDIAADAGTTVKAAASGVVTFAGWKSNGGGYQVWISHGSGLYTTYNHMSSISVGRGQHVGRGQQVGRVGSTGNATGPHLHFEVWKGPIWDGGTRVNPLAYL